MTSDRGTQFTSEIWTELGSCLGIKHSPTSAYHPQGNGMVERYHRQLKDALRARLAGADWYHHLLWVLLGLRSAPKEDSAVSSAEMVYGSPLTLPGQFLDAPDPPNQEFIQDIREKVNLKPPPPPRRALQSRVCFCEKRWTCSATFSTILWTIQSG